VNALLVCAAPAPGAADLVARLAASADLVIAVDGGGAVCREAGVQPDILVGDFDSLESSLVDEFVSAGVRIVEYPADKDETDLALALAVARREGVDRVTVTAASTGRLDHTLAVAGTLAAAADLQPRLREPELRGWVVSTALGSRLTLKGMGATVSILAPGWNATVSVRGVRWPLTKAELAPLSVLGMSNIITDGAGAVIEVHAGTVLVLSPHVDLAPAVEIG